MLDRNERCRGVVVALSLLAALDTASSQSPSRAELEVPDCEQYRPTAWKLTIHAPPEADLAIVASSPRLEVQLWRDGDWRECAALPGASSRSRCPLALHLRTSDVPVPRSSASPWTIELSDWRVLGWPGRCRARALWSEAALQGTGTPRREVLRRTDGWVEFVVRAEARPSPLTRCRDAGDEVWDAYRNVMAGAVGSTFEFGDYLTEWSRASDATRVFFDTNLPPGFRIPHAVLLAEPDLPDEVRQRCLFLAALHERQLARAHGKGPSRAEAADRCQRMLQQVATGASPLREYAMFVALDVARATRSPRREELERAIETDPACRAVARQYPELHDRLFAEEHDGKTDGAPSGR